MNDWQNNFKDLKFIVNFMKEIEVLKDNFVGTERSWKKATPLDTYVEVASINNVWRPKYCKVT